MRRLCLPSLLLCAVCLSGCLARNRLNTSCEWTHDEPRRLDLQRSDDRRHLNDDVEIAEELGIRHGDSFRQRDGLLAVRGKRTECTAILFAEIARVHGVSSVEVLSARGHRSPAVDVAVLFSFGSCFVWFSAWALRGLFNRFPIDVPLPAITAIAVTSAMVSAGAQLALGMWADMVEIVRRGDMHGSYRVGRQPWGHHVPELFVSGVVLFWLIALWHLWRERTSYGR